MRNNSYFRFRQSNYIYSLKPKFQEEFQLIQRLAINLSRIIYFASHLWYTIHGVYPRAETRGVANLLEHNTQN